jgi:hypothetical protein
VILFVVDTEEIPFLQIGQVELFEGGVDRVALGSRYLVGRRAVFPRCDLVYQFREGNGPILFVEVVYCVAPTSIAWRIRLLVARASETPTGTMKRMIVIEFRKRFHFLS